MPPGAIVLSSARMRTRVALLLLLTLSLTLGLGTHPCAAAGEERPGTEAKAPAAVPSCHAHAAQAPDPEPSPKPGHCGGSGHPCPHVCHVTALPAVAPPIPTMQVVAQLAIAPVENTAAAPARSIDHVPLP